MNFKNDNYLVVSAVLTAYVLLMSVVHWIEFGL